MAEQASALPAHPLRLSDLAGRKDTHFELTPDAGGRTAVADALSILGVRKLRFAGRLSPLGKTDWRLEASLGATVVQACVVTLDPVVTRIDEDVVRTYAADVSDPDLEEIEMPDDDTTDPLPLVLDVAEVMIEALSLALPPFPRAPKAELGSIQVTEPGKTALQDEDTKPFAGLSALRDALKNNDDEPKN